MSSPHEWSFSFCKGLEHMLGIASAARSDHWHSDCLRYKLCQSMIKACLFTISIHTCQQNLSCPSLHSFLRPVADL
ncbi:hypothetical protein CGLO_14618 [Colletotrichum gloeosporioides Cg-14]|uniref:Uncharacterized protein n=1 Tax=Colletotrichum gloeosporioides (strain Cg-14) TaxID=1237896 RepID=T0K0P3_COLGC|nr:hypothetical protein CGLO_14618 [Colletotrichum gloeosporioides Cg-14]